MSDLYLALLIMTLIGISLFLVTFWFCRKLKLKALRLFAAIVVAFIIGFDLWLLDSRLILRFVPFQAAIVCANFLIPLSAVLAAVLLKFPTPLWRRIIFSLPLVIMAYGYNLRQILVQTPPCGDKWQAGVCLQTRQSSCAAAAAATLLYYHGIDANEKEMAQLCLTSEKGTYLHGLYRGLKIKTQNLPIQVHAGAADFDFLRQKENLPLILYVKLTEQLNQQDPRYARDWGWIVDVDHTVVLFRYTNDERIIIGDPGNGREIWDILALRDLWQGQYVSLKRTDTN